ncbi:cysteine desulfurase-like protein [Lysinibacillus telephonicus]|uniref:Cysteine desulfurase-like protein n=1 Tax=Lysinibacillus telephonicus TaxID=1714840 RepID=A0A3S0HEL9_9BACI|nr:cysteine desulfurase-like protein [Lysinibacillus telephonicus]RTQ89706.1 cysteine desulfurase-like protein [Lysinibacillus telephonicus]
MIQLSEIRQHFPALNRTENGLPVAYFDGPGGSQVAQPVIDAIVAYMTNGGSNLHGEFATSKETEQCIDRARQAIADLVGAKPTEVAFGQNSTSLMFAVARALSRTWTNEDNIVLSEIDHRSNVDSWITAAQDKNTNVRFIPVDTNTLSLDISELSELIDSNTKIVAVSLASNVIGTITDVAPIVKRAREVGAIVIVDAVHAVPHFAVDFHTLDVDILFCSTYKFFGPHLGVAVIKEALFDSLNVYKLKPAPSYFPDKLETGTQNHESIASLESLVEFIASFGNGNNRREKIVSAYEVIEKHEKVLDQRLRGALAEIPEVTLYQSPYAKTPTIAFRIEKIDPISFCQQMASRYSIYIASGDFYATTLCDKLGITEKGGFIRAGLAPYNTEQEIDRLISATQAIIEAAQITK